MAFRALHLARPQKLLFKASRRAIKPESVVRSLYTGQPSAEDSNLGTTPTVNDGPNQNQNASEIHWALWPGYKIGKKIPRTTGGQISTSEPTSAVPYWNPRSIPIKFQFRNGPTYKRLPTIWLRDNCQCSECVNQDTRQRALDTFSIPRSIQPVEVSTEKDGLKVIWANDGHVSVYPWDMILGHRDRSNFGLVEPKPSGKPPLRGKNNFKFWGPEIATDPPAVHYDEIMADDKGVGKWTQKIREYGFCYVDGCPVSPEKTQELLERISFIRRTHYGGFYDFTADLTMKDTAYTTQALSAHTDTTYFTDPAGLQMFHLLSHTQGEGGASLLVDGFKAAEILKAKHERAFECLSTRQVPWHASGNEGITIAPSKKMPVFSFGHVHDQTGSRLMQIRWNNDDRGIFDIMGDQSRKLPKFVSIEEWYWAAGLWNNILKSEEMEYWAQLKPGRPLIFDNWRVLHGRSAFTGKRRICGGYINHDDYISRWRNTNLSREDAIAHARF